MNRIESSWSSSFQPLGLANALLLASLFAVGCRQPELGRDAYFVAVSLDQVIERRDASQLARADELIAEQLESGKITEQEAKGLTELVARAEQGEWERARQETRAILEAQTDW